MDSSSDDHSFESSDHSGGDPPFVSEGALGLLEEGEVEAPLNPRGEEEEEGRGANLGGGRVAEDDDGPPSPDMGGVSCSTSTREAFYAAYGAGPSAERTRSGFALNPTRAQDFFEGRRLGRLENQDAYLETKINHLQGQVSLYAGSCMLGGKHWRMSSGGGSRSLAATPLPGRIEVAILLSLFFL